MKFKEKSGVFTKKKKSAKWVGQTKMEKGANWEGQKSINLLFKQSY